MVVLVGGGSMDMNHRENMTLVILMLSIENTMDVQMCDTSTALFKTCFVQDPQTMNVSNSRLESIM